MLQEIDDPAWILQPQFGPIIEQLITADLRFDALVRSVHLPHIITLIERHPNLKLIIDHGAKPAIKNQEWRDWADPLKALSQSDKVFCKLSGLLTETKPGQPWHEVTPYMDLLLQHFGSTRLAWGSDWPVLNLASDFGTWFRQFSDWLEHMGKTTQQQILGSNAIQFYDLKL